MNAAYRAGWDRIFGPKTPPKMITNPFNLRKDVRIQYEVPQDFNLHDLRRLVTHLATMCEDWEPEMGWPDVSFPNPEGPHA